MPYSFTNNGVRSTRQFDTVKEAVEMAAYWLGVNAENKAFPTVQIVKVSEAKDPVGDFHRSRGCCDGSDPSGCFKRIAAENDAAREVEREAARLARLREADEYAGTAPSGEAS